MFIYISNKNKFFLLFMSLLLIILIGLFSSSIAHEKIDESNKVTVEEKVGTTIPSDIKFTDENGTTKTIKELINGKPSIISFVYYSCPGICNEILERMADTVADVGLTIGKDYSLLSVSVDPNETSQQAIEKKNELIGILDNKSLVKDWKFLVSDKENIHKLSEATGFYFRKEKDGTFTHPSAIIFISPEGKITKYMYGSAYLPVAVKMSLKEAAEGKTGPSIATVIEFCFNYDPESRRFVVDITRIAGIVTLIFMLGLLVFLIFKKKKTGIN